MNTDSLSWKECRELFNNLFSNGFTGEDVKRDIVPEGWAHSPLKKVFHPSPEQRYKEYIQMKHNISELTGEENEIETFEQFEAEYEDTPVDPERELTELVGLCMWDVFSDNHDVIAPDGRITDLGSARGSAGFIADWISEQQNGLRGYNYMDFYMGTRLVSQRADLTPVYRMIFNRLQSRECDWRYHFPQLYLINPNKDKSDSENPEDYDPGKAMVDELNEENKMQKHKKLKDEIEQMNREAAEEAAQNDPPSIVSAYAEVYGYLPKGWPPV